MGFYTSLPPFSTIIFLLIPSPIGGFRESIWGLAHAAPTLQFLRSCHIWCLHVLSPCSGIRFAKYEYYLRDTFCKTKSSRIVIRDRRIIWVYLVKECEWLPPSGILMKNFILWKLNFTTLLLVLKGSTCDVVLGTPRFSSHKPPPHENTGQTHRGILATLRR